MAIKRKKRNIRSVSERMIAILSALENGYNISGSLRAAHVGHRDYYNWIKTDPEFSLQVDKAIEKGSPVRIRQLEDTLDECWRKAPQNPQYQPSLFLALKAAAPRRYCDKYQQLNSDFNYQEFVQRILKHDSDEPTSSNSGGDA